jgi:protein-disulfide isomerase
MRLIVSTFALASVLLSAAACQRPEADKRLDVVLNRLDTIDKRLANIERRGPAAGAAAAQPQRPRADANTVYYLPVGDGDVAIGPKNAKVTVVEAFDFACPYCNQTAPVMEQLAQKYPNDVRIVYRQFVVHPDTATLPALGACAAAKQGKLHAYAVAVWKRGWPEGKGLSRDGLAQASLEQAAAEAKLDVARFKGDMAGDACKQELQAGMQALSQVGVGGTPAIYVNGRPYQGARSVEALSAAVDQEIARADDAAKQGVRAEDYYASLMKTAKKTL